MSWAFQPLLPASAQQQSGEGAPTYTLAAETGAVTLGATNSSLTVSRQVTADAGGFAMSGQDAAPQAAYRFGATGSTLAATGQAAGFSTATALDADYGSFVLAGQTVNLSTERRIAASGVAYAAAGQDAALTMPAILFPGEPASIGLTGQSAALAIHRRLFASSALMQIAETEASVLLTLPINGGRGPINLGLSLSL